MISRAVYLWAAIDQFIDDAEEREKVLKRYELSPVEWNMSELLLTILMPFKQASQILQQTTRPSIDEVFYTYEFLFNKIDQLKATFNLPENQDKDWVQTLHIAVKAMSKKLVKHYNRADKPFVYFEGVILEPRGKLVLFQQKSFPGHNMASKYKDACRKRYTTEYQSSAWVEDGEEEAQSSRKRTFSERDEYHGGYRSFLNQVAASQSPSNEFDRYMAMAPPDQYCTTLEWWKQNQFQFPNLALMARDVFAVPFIGVDVERRFSQSEWIATWVRSLLKPETVCDLMKYKDLLVRRGEVLAPRNYRTFSSRAEEEAYEKRLNEENEEEDEDDEDADERRYILHWEEQWWQKLQGQNTRRTTGR